ncbi:MAG: hypothetical protein ACR2MP_14330 [Streptosporangiaceae bacterium]
MDAIIVMDVETRDERLPVLRSLRLPTVLIGFPAEPAGLTCIDLDFEAAGKTSAEHLAAAGPRRGADRRAAGGVPAQHRLRPADPGRVRAGCPGARVARGHLGAL